MTNGFGTTLSSTLSRAVGDWSRTDGWTLSAALAYYGALSLFPFCLLIISGVGYWSYVSPGFEDQQNKLVLAVADDMSPWLGKQLELLLAGIKSSAVVAGPLGVLSLFVTAITLFVQLDTSFDRIWAVASVKSKGIWGALRTTLHERLSAFLVLLGLAALLGTLFLVNVVLASLQAFVMHWSSSPLLWKGIQVIVTWGLNGILLTGLYRAMPKVPVRLRTAVIGGMLAASVWQIGQRLLEAFVISDKYTAYGIVGSFLAVMLWMYYASAVVLFGAMIVRNLEPSLVRTK